MYYYQEIKSNEFILRNIQEDTSCKDCFINEITCRIINKVIIFKYNHFDGLRHVPIKTMDGIILYENYHTCSNSVFGENLILLLKSLGYKAYSSRGDSVVIRSESIAIPVYKLNSSSSVFVSIDKNECELEDILCIPYYNNVRPFFDVYSDKPTKSNYLQPFIKDKRLYITCGNRNGTIFETRNLQYFINNIYRFDIHIKLFFITIIKFIEDYINSIGVKGRKNKFQFYRRMIIKKGCSENEAYILFSDYINELIQKKIINKHLQL